jgi:hypothetical protein
LPPQSGDAFVLLFLFFFFKKKTMSLAILPLEGGDCRRRAAMPVTLGEHAGAAASCPDASSFGTDTGRGGPTTKKTPALN